MAKRKPKQPKTIPAITLQQPYCWLLMEGHVTTEKRTGPIDYRGPVAIVAGKRHGYSDLHVVRIQRDYPDCPDIDDLTYGAIIGVVDLADCRVTDEPGMRYVWKLKKPRRLKKPKPFTGTGQLIEVEAKLVRGLL